MLAAGSFQETMWQVCLSRLCKNNTHMWMSVSTVQWSWRKPSCQATPTHSTSSRASTHHTLRGWSYSLVTEYGHKWKGTVRPVGFCLVQNYTLTHKKKCVFFTEICRNVERTVNYCWWHLQVKGRSVGIPSIFSSQVGRDSSVGIEMRYGQDDPRIESRWGEIIRTRPDRSWGATQPPKQWVPRTSRG